ncbi:MAG: tail fiber domain-containing protein [Bacteroidales bacterium]|nr:tail fiber domain-containing protein [Bacteroidales bacterium]
MNQNYSAGFNNVSDLGNIFIGKYAGLNELESYKLYIENFDTNSANALIFGEFDNDSIRLNVSETILKLHPVKFKYSDEWKKRNPTIKDKYYYNFIAQEFKEVFPNSVKGSGKYLKDDKEEILQLDSYNAQIVAIKAIQELIKENKELKAKINQINELSEQINELKQLIDEKFAEGH